MLHTQLTVSRFFNKPDFFLDVQQESAGDSNPNAQPAHVESI